MTLGRILVRMNHFREYHPIVNFMYFTAILIISIFMYHPAFIVISFVCSLFYLISLKGVRKTLKSIRYVMIIAILIGITNPLFNHQGVTILFYNRIGNPVTKEAIIFGIFMALLFMAVIQWFQCYNEVITSDKFLYLFGRIMPSFSLVLSMTIRYVDRFSKRFRELKKYRDNQLKCGKRRYFPRIKNFAGIVSAMIFWSLENSIETSDSMKDRGYGLRGRTSFSLYKFTSRDMGPFVYMLISIVIIVWGAMNEKLEYRYYPSFSDDLFGVFMCITYVVFFILCIIPLIIELKFRIKFKNKPEDKNK